MTDRTLQNFVNGKFTDAGDGRTSDVIDPSTGEVFDNALLSRRQEVDAAMKAAENPLVGWRDATPSERSLALIRIADAIEERADELIEAETRNTGKPVALTRSEEIPPSVDQIRFFAGAARVLEGRSAGEYMKDHTSMIRREPIGVCAQVEALLAQYRPRAVLNFAAESHVDRSIHGPAEFFATNLVGTFGLLQAVRGYWSGLPARERARFRLLHVSTDEVFGSLEPTAPSNQEGPSSTMGASSYSSS